jgi:hypothetical protein
MPPHTTTPPLRTARAPLDERTDGREDDCRIQRLGRLFA